MEQKDWHSADIVAALKKRGTSLSAESRKAGYAPTSLANVLVRPWTKGEQIIAAAIGIPADKIWPSRYQKRRYTKPRKANS